MNPTEYGPWVVLADDWAFKSEPLPFNKELKDCIAFELYIDGEVALWGTKRLGMPTYDYIKQLAYNKSRSGGLGKSYPRFKELGII